MRGLIKCVLIRRHYYLRMRMNKISFTKVFLFRTRKSQANINLRDRCLCASTRKEPHAVADQVELTSVTKRFNDVVAVDSISLLVKPGEFFSILGPSGCGKTTTLRMISGFEHIDEGTIKIGERIVNSVPAFKRNVGMVFQYLALFPHLDVFGNIAYGLKTKRVQKSEIAGRVKDALELVGLSGFEKRRISQVSGGQRQRVALARALVTEPNVLCLDEPLGALDLKLRLQMQVEIKRLQQKVKNTFIYVTHDQGEAITMSDRVAIMAAGKVEQVGNPREIYEHPKTRFVADFIGETNLFEAHATSENAVELDGIIIDSAVSTELVGKRVFVSIRPENISLGPTIDSSISPKLEGVVEIAMYRGSYVTYKIRVGEKLLINTSGPSRGERLNSGDHVQLGWKKEDAVILPAVS